MEQPGAELVGRRVEGRRARREALQHLMADLRRVGEGGAGGGCCQGAGEGGGWRGGTGRASDLRPDPFADVTCPPDPRPTNCRIRVGQSTFRSVER